MPQNVLLVNGAKRFPPDRFARLAAAADVSVITMPQFAARYPGAVHLELVDSLYDFGRIRDAAAAIYRARGLGCVLGPAERSVPATGLIRSYFGLPGYGFETALACTNKHLMKERLRAAGLPVTDWITVPTVERVPDAVAALGGTVVVKPVFGGGGQNTFVLDSPAGARQLADSERSAQLRKNGFPLIVERFVEMTAEYHCDGVMYDGKVRFAAVSRYHDPLLDQIGLLSGSSIVPDSDPVAEPARELHRRSVEALGLTSGVSHLELFQTASGLLVSEIACRPGGPGIPEMIQMQYGVDLWQAFIDLSLGQEPEVSVSTGERTFARANLPIRAGRVTALSSPAELASVRDVTGVEMDVAPGDIIGDHMHTGTTTARVYFALRDPADLRDRLAELSAAYRFEVEPARAD